MVLINADCRVIIALGQVLHMEGSFRAHFIDGEFLFWSQFHILFDDCISPEAKPTRVNNVGSRWINQA